MSPELAPLRPEEITAIFLPGKPDFPLKFDLFLG
jgi:hypothetical protein